LPHTTLSRPDADELPPVIYPRLPGRRRADLGRSTDGAWRRPAVDPHPRILCGICGLKPTHSLVPYTGIMPIELTSDHTGPMTATVEDNALLLEVLAGPDGLDPREYGAAAKPCSEALGGGAAGLKIAVVEEGFGHPQSLP
jgi:Asp-tRNA(Asn)/Glu-tRNA(Gln) amidotransferase A subunit family amidase